MKKRLLSMLMAVLMIASLVPATALAADTTADDEYLINIKADATAKQPGITVKATNDGYDVTIKAFAKIKDQCKVCTDLVTKELIPATCEQKGLTVYYCGTCGKEMMKPLVADKLAHEFQFTVVEKATCTTDGWGYAVCKLCGTAKFIENSGYAYALSKVVNGDEEEVALNVQKMFEATGHKNAVAVTKDVLDKDGNVYAKAAVAPAHAVTIGGYAVAYKDGEIVSASVKDSEVAEVAGYTGDKVCADCGVLVENGKALNSLDVDHADYMKVITAGSKPYIDADGDKIDGATDYVYCAKCNAYFGGDVLTYDEFFRPAAEETTPAIGTTMIPEKDMNLANGVVAKAAVAATCKAEGYTGDTVTYSQTGIDKDGKAVGTWVLTKTGEKIEKLAHHYVAYENVAATCTDKGTAAEGWYVCDNVVGKDENGKDVKCGETKHDFIYKAPYEVPALGHDFTVEKVLVEATCQDTGLSIRVCSVCGAYELDRSGAPAVEVTAKVDHVAADELANVVEATCTEAGYSGDQVCKWCGETLKKGEEVPALGHATEIKDAKDATCTEAGYTGDEVCTVCGETVKKGEEIPALGHKFENGVCTVCGAADPDYVVPNPFKDVEKTSPYYDAIIWAADKGITTGKTADTFGINDGCTRAQIVTFLYRAAGSPEVKADTVNPFTDVSKDSVYYNAILWAVEKGITKGTTATTFDPNAVCTRGQIVTFLFRASGDEKVATGTNFADVAAGSYCADAVAWAVANKVANGFADGTFRPEATCTRGQAVTFIYRALAE